MLPCPNDEFRAVGEETAGDVGRRIGLCPSDDVENPESCLLQGIGHRKDIVVRAANPYCPIVFQFLPAECYPMPVEFVNGSRGLAFIPVSFVYVDDFSALEADAAVAEEVGRIGEYRVEPENINLKCGSIQYAFYDFQLSRFQYGITSYPQSREAAVFYPFVIFIEVG